MHQRWLECRQIPFLLLFSTHTVCLRHLWDVRPNTSSWFFLFSGPLVEVLFWSTLKVVPSIIRGRIARVFIPLIRFLLRSLVSSSFLVPLIYSFFFLLRMFNSVHSQYYQVFVSFHFSERSDFFLICYFYSFCHMLFSSFHYWYGIFFFDKFYPYNMNVYSHCLY